jgi:hypothetical protein
MNKYTFWLILISLLIVFDSKAQSNDTVFKNQYTIYINQPIGFATKARLALECRFNNNYAWLVSYARFYGLLPGQHAYFELRKYTNNQRNIDYVKYAKIGAGHSFESVGMYVFAGAGVGQKIYFDRNLKFSLMCTQGVKIAPNVRGKHDTGTGGFGGLFYFSGPGAFFDINFNLGYRF